MIGTIEHVSDGDVPQSILAVVPGGEVESDDSPLAKWVAGKWMAGQAVEREDAREVPDTFLARFLHLLAAVDGKPPVNSEAQTGKPKIPGMTWLPKPPK